MSELEAALHAEKALRQEVLRLMDPTDGTMHAEYVLSRYQKSLITLIMALWQEHIDD